MSLIQKKYWCDACGCNHEIRHQEHDIEKWLKKAKADNRCIEDNPRVMKTKMFNTEYKQIQPKNIFVCMRCRKSHVIPFADAKYLPSKCCHGSEMVFRGVFIDMVR